MSATADLDGDRVVNLDEYRARTIPTNSDSFLGMLSPPLAGGPPGLIVRWRRVKDRTCQVDRATNLLSSAAYTNVFANVPGQADYTTVTDTTATAAGPYLYRVRTQPWEMTGPTARVLDSAAPRPAGGPISCYTRVLRH